MSTALLTADEAARLRPGEQLVIVRAGDRKVEPHVYTERSARARLERRRLAGEELFMEQRESGWYTGRVVAPQDWVALTGPCPNEHHRHLTDGHWHDDCLACRQRRRDGGIHCPDCRDGRRIVPLYTECPGELHYEYDDESQLLNCERCGGTCRVLVGRAAVQVVPILDRYDDQALRPEQVAIVLDGYECPVLWLGNGDLRLCALDPMPVAGRDFGVILDVVEVA